MRAFLVALVCVMAGCATQAPAADETPAPVPAGPEQVSAVEPEPQVLAVSWEDSLVDGAWLCDSVSGTCHWTSPDAYGVEHDTPLPAGNLTNAFLDLTWEATGEVTRSLTFGIAIQDTTCDCPPDHSEEVSGVAPLRIEVPALHLSEDHRLSMWVYASMIHGVSEAGAYAYAGLSARQDFEAAGELVVASGPPQGPR